MNRKFLFVSGCPRSGTTVLTDILNWSDSIFVGQERFAGLLNRHREEFVPELFALPRLAQFRNGDCDYPSYGAKNEYFTWYVNQKNFSKLDEYTSIGDKITNLYRHFDAFSGPAWAKRDVTVLHIVRNVLDVAASYQTRKHNPKDRWNLDYVQAIADWTQSIVCAHKLSEEARVGGAKIGIVDYDLLFGETFQEFVASAKLVYGFLGEEFSTKQLGGMERIFLAFNERKRLRVSHDEILDDVRARISSDVSAMHHALSERSVNALLSPAIGQHGKLS